MRRPPPRPSLDEIHFVLRGPIGSWKRPAERKLGTGKARRFTDGKVRSYLGLVRERCEQAMGDKPPLEGVAFELSVLAVYVPPKHWSAKKKAAAYAGLVPKITRPDLDNAAIKGIKDAMREVVYRDDAQVVCFGRCLKVYGEIPRLEVLLTVVDRVDPILPAMPVYEQPDLFRAIGGGK